MTTRRDAFSKGLKHGVAKRGIDKALNPFSGPISDSISEKLKEMSPNAEVPGEMVDSAVRCALLMASAELLEVAAPHVDSDALKPKKVAAVSTFLREYAGEKAGGEVVEFAMRIVPLVMEAFSDVSMSDLQEMIANTDSAVVEEEVPEKKPEEEEEAAELFSQIPLLEEEPSPKKKTTKKKAVAKKRKKKQPQAVAVPIEV